MFRHARLILDKLPTHPEARSCDNDIALQQLRKDVLRNFPKLEKFKPRINKRYDRYRRLLEDRRQAKATKNQALSSPPRVPADGFTESGHARLPSDSALENGQETLIAGENRDLAVKLAHKEIRRRATARKATRQAGISEEEEHGRRTAGLWGDWEEALTRNDQSIDQTTLAKQMNNIRSQVNGSRRNPSDHADSHPSFERQASHYRYPSVPLQHAHDRIKQSIPTPIVPTNVSGASTTLPPPQRPPKDIDMSIDPQSLHHTSSKEEISHTESLDRSTTASPAQQDLKPSTFTFKPSAYLENGTPLRTIFLPPSLRHRFLSIALPNTRANLETCGILCGTLISNALFISKLVIPEQESTSDTCETVNESDLFDYVDGED